MLALLDSLNDQMIGAYTLRVETLGRARFFDQRHFALYLFDADGHRPAAPVFYGLYNAGRPSIHVPTWIDGEFVEQALDLIIAEEIARRLGALIPPGGRLWFAYETFGDEGELARETRIALAARVPLIATPMGWLLFQAGCWTGMRDWDIPEGGREGPRKLQGNKPVNRDDARWRATEISAILKRFIVQEADAEISRRAQRRARKILQAFESTEMWQ